MLALVGASCGVEQPPDGLLGLTNEGPLDDSAPEATGGGEGRSASGTEQIALIDRARQSLVDGALPEAIQAEIITSTSPQLAAARRIFGGEGASSAAPAVPRVAAGSKGSVPLRVPGAAPAARIPEKKTAVPATSEVAAGDSDAPRKQTEAARPSVASGDTTPAPAAEGKGARLVMLTSLALKEVSGGVVLDVRSSGQPSVSVASQATRGRVTFMFANAGALPTVRQARPGLQGVRVSEVRRGDTTVQVTVELEEEWQARRPALTDGGVQVRFQRVGDAAL